MTENDELRREIAEKLREIATFKNIGIPGVLRALADELDRPKVQFMAGGWAWYNGGPSPVLVCLQRRCDEGGGWIVTAGTPTTFLAYDRFISPLGFNLGDIARQCREGKLISSKDPPKEPQ